MSDLHKRMEKCRFLRRLAEARRRYGGRPAVPAGTVDCQPDEPPDPAEIERPVIPHTRPKGAPSRRRPPEEP